MPDLLIDSLIFVGGLAGVTVGADWVVRGGSQIAKRLGIPPLVIGLTIVAFGTSAPELVVSGGAAIRNEPGMAIGNVMGSTVANVGLIVGLGALIRPISVHRRLLVRESPLLILVMAAVMILSLNEALGRLDGLALLTGFFVYMFFLIRWSAAGDRVPADLQPGEEDVNDADWPYVRDWSRTILGLAGLLVGGHYLLEGAVAIAQEFNVSDAVIGATVVAIGTSLPELASTVAAAARRLGDIAIGNVIGSNIFNLGLVLGSAAMLRPLNLPSEAVVRQVVPALVFSLLLLVLAYRGLRVQRWEGCLLLLCYGGFIYWVI